MSKPIDYSGHIPDSSQDPWRNHERDYNGYIPSEPSAGTNGACSTPHVPDPCSTCCAAALELAELKGYLRGISIVAERNLARLSELTEQAREQHAKEG